MQKTRAEYKKTHARSLCKTFCHVLKKKDQQFHKTKAKIMKVRDCLASYALCFLVIQVKVSNSRTSWRLNADKVVKSTSTGANFVPILEEEQILDILMGSATLDNGQGWSRSAPIPAEKIQIYCKDCANNLPSNIPPERFEVLTVILFSICV